MVKVNLTFEEIDLLEQSVRYFKSDILMHLAKTNDTDENFIERLNLLLIKFNKLLEHHV